MKLYFEWPSLWLNIAFVVASVVCVCYLIGSRLSCAEHAKCSRESWQHFFRSNAVKAFYLVFSFFFCLANFAWIAKLINSHSSEEFNLGLLFYTLLSIIGGCSMVCALEDASLSGRMFAASVLISLVGLAVMIFVHFEGIYYCLGALTFSFLGAMFAPSDYED